MHSMDWIHWRWYIIFNIHSHGQFLVLIFMCIIMAKLIYVFAKRMLIELMEFGMRNANVFVSQPVVLMENMEFDSQLTTISNIYNA